jgi:ADP-ribose pyrophosphatase
MAVEEWDLVESELVGEYGVFDVVRRRARSPRDGAVHEFHVLELPDSVIMVPLTADGRVLMVQQFRHGVQRVTLEFPAGFLEPGEDPVQGAVRELEEETGYRAAEAVRVAVMDPDSAKQCAPAHVVVARGCTPTGRQDQDGGEDVHITLLPVERVDALIRTGEIRSASDIAVWLLHRQHEDGGGNGESR